MLVEFKEMLFTAMHISLMQDWIPTATSSWLKVIVWVSEMGLYEVVSVLLVNSFWHALRLAKDQNERFQEAKHVLLSLISKCMPR